MDERGKVWVQIEENLLKSCDDDIELFERQIVRLTESIRLAKRGRELTQQGIDDIKERDGEAQT